MIILRMTLKIKKPKKEGEQNRKYSSTESSEKCF